MSKHIVTQNMGENCTVICKQTGKEKYLSGLPIDRASTLSCFLISEARKAKAKSELNLSHLIIKRGLKKVHAFVPRLNHRPEQNQWTKAITKAGTF